VERAGDGSGIVVQPGVAIDRLGREVVIPRTHQLSDPRQPSDDHGAPCGERVDTGVLVLYVEYAEFAERPIATEDGQEHALIREGYCLRPLAGGPPPPEPAVSSDDCQALVAAPKHQRRQLLVSMLGRAIETAGDPGVPLAVLRWSEGGEQPIIEPATVRLPARGLFDLILCLIERLEGATGGALDAPGRTPDR
jgi:hypothetical protein